MIKKQQNSIKLYNEIVFIHARVYFWIFFQKYEEYIRRFSTRPSTEYVTFRNSGHHSVNYVKFPARFLHNIRLSDGLAADLS